MPVAIIKIIGRKIFDSLCSLMLFIMSIYFVFITTASVYITLHTTHNKKDTNGKDDKDNIWEYYTINDIISEAAPTDIIHINNEPHIDLYLFGYYSILIIMSATSLTLCYFLCNWEYIEYRLRSLYNWLFCRKPARQNEPVVLYLADRMYRRGELSIPSLESSSEADSNSES
ncbi:uncharacterized protein LOC112637082 [Camponotus floridanus]|uniref:uncharacterized protein LOC112637082 n=1 Tax=Camponotus floridanus TaxID=104421 RepID=UPI000DC671D1|nr:uncharacterized protein LOC112637082 [Camponotus floridanus]